MSAVALQIAIMVAVLGPLVWLATRRSGPRGGQRPSGGQSWSSDGVYNIADSGPHGAGGHDAGAGYSAGAGDSGGGSDGGGGGSDSSGGGSSD